MKTQILCRQQIVGEADLTMYDPGMNIYSGQFRATPAYNEIRSVFKVFACALDRMGNEKKTQLDEYYRQRDNLELTILNRDGVRLSASWIHIIDLEGDLDGLLVEVALNDALGESS